MKKTSEEAILDLVLFRRTAASLTAWWIVESRGPVTVPGRIGDFMFKSCFNFIICIICSDDMHLRLGSAALVL